MPKFVGHGNFINALDINRDSFITVGDDMKL